MRSFTLTLFVLFISFVSKGQVSREDFAEMVFDNLYSSNNNPFLYDAAFYPNPFLDVDDTTSEGIKVKILSYLTYQTEEEVPFDRNPYFFPNSDIREGEAIKAIVEAWNVPYTFYATSPFNGIDIGDEFYGDYCTAYYHGLISSNVNPNSFISNIEAQDFMTAMSNSQFSPVSFNTLSDTNNYFVPSISPPESLSLFKGLEQGIFSHYAKNSFTIPDIQMSLNFSHFYSTAIVTLPEFYTSIEPLGRGWTHTYNIYAQREYFDTDNDGNDEEVLSITWPDGTVHTWDESNSEWLTEGVYNDAVRITVSGTDRLNVWTKNHEQYRFEQLRSGREVFYLTKISDRNGNDIEIEYEDAEEPSTERISKVKSPSNKELVFTYHSGTDRINTITDPIGRVISFTYLSERLRRFYDAKNNETRYSYLGSSSSIDIDKYLLDEVRLPNLNKVVATYDTTNDNYLSSYQVNDNTPIQYSVQLDYSLAQPLHVEMNVPMPDGGMDLNIADYNSLGLLESFQSGTDDLTVTYPSANAPNPFLPTQVDNHNIKVEYDYDVNGNVEKIDYENGDRIYEFDWSGQNNLNWSEDPNNNRTYFTYDNDHNLTQITDPLSNVTYLTYDNFGNVTSVTNQEGIVVNFTYENDGALSTFSAPENIGGSFLYDGINRLTSKTVNGLTSAYSYDNNDNITSFINSGQHTTSYNYDDNDNVVGLSNANNVSTIFTYNTKDQLTSETFGTLQTSYSYNDDDTLDVIQKPSGDIINIDYTSEGQYDGSGTVNHTNYDSNERLEEIGTTNIRYDFDFDNLNQIDRVKVVGNPNRDIQYHYDAVGNITRTYYPNAGTDAYILNYYDVKNRLTKVRCVNFTGLADTDLVEYQYYKDDRIKEVEYRNEVKTTYSYDGAGRPIGIKHENVLGEILYEETRTLNNRSNVLSHNIGYSSSDDLYAFIPSIGEQNFSYDNNNHITSSGYNVNADGNTLNAPEWTFLYDIDDQVTLATTSSGSGYSMTMEYDAYGNRTHKTVSPGNNTEYVWDILNKNIIQEYTGGTTNPNNFIYGIGLESSIKNGTINYYLGDLRGNVVLWLDVAGNRIQDYQYDEFGKTSRVNPGYNPDLNHFTFLGKYGIVEDNRDEGLYYIRARYYDASIGRFITEDPVDSENLYIYSGNNPISQIDISGAHPVAVVAIIGFVLWDFFTDVNFAGDVAPTIGQKLPWQIANTVGLPTKVGINSAKSYIKHLVAKNATKQLALPSGGKIVKHHIFNLFRGNAKSSQKYRDFFAKHNIDLDAYTIHIPENLHKQLHKAGNNWTTKWKRWIDANPNATTEEVYHQAGRMLEEYGVLKYLIKPYK